MISSSTFESTPQSFEGRFLRLFQLQGYSCHRERPIHAAYQEMWWCHMLYYCCELSQILPLPYGTCLDHFQLEAGGEGT